MPRAQLDRQPRDVASMFDAVAERYDRMNAVMTAGQERRWRRTVVRELHIGPGDRVLDLAAGTGASSLPIERVGAQAVACDFSLGMLRVGAARHPQLGLVAGDALHLPFSANAFDAATISFGLRNVANVDLVLQEMARVTRPGGRLVVLETSAPLRQPMRAGHGFYVKRVLPRLARLVASNDEAYEYLAESVADWVSPRGLADQITGAGWGQVAWQQLLFGAVALHTAVRKSDALDSPMRSM